MLYVLLLSTFSIAYVMGRNIQRWFVCTSRDLACDHGALAPLSIVGHVIGQDDD